MECVRQSESESADEHLLIFKHANFPVTTMHTCTEFDTQCLCLTICPHVPASCHLPPHATLQRAQQDTGNLLPGHGGILDRVDSYMLTAAPVYFFVKFCLPLIAAFV